MRIKTYFRLIIKENLVEELPFESQHYKELGIPQTPEFGMHKLNALELLNKWNAKAKGHYVYFTE